MLTRARLEEMRGLRREGFLLNSSEQDLLISEVIALQDAAWQQVKAEEAQDSHEWVTALEALRALLPEEEG